MSNPNKALAYLVALTYLVQLIQEGYDYIDAEWKASDKFKVNHLKLRLLYDNR